MRVVFDTSVLVAAARHQYLQEEQEFLTARKNCPLQKSPMGLQFCQDENG